MLNRLTTFVIGAGAGFDLNMPVGEQLSRSIAEKTDIYFESGNQKTRGDTDLYLALKKIAAQQNGDVNDWCAVLQTGGRLDPDAS
jgi:thiamine pyrophosphokinase